MDIERISRVTKHVKNSHEVYWPKNIWELITIRDINEIMPGGIRNFKRTINRFFAQDISLNVKDIYIPHLMEFLSCERPIGNFSVNGLDFSDSDSAMYYGLYVSLLWDACARFDRDNLFQDIYEPKFGNPVFVEYQGRELTQDLAKSIIDFLIISPLIDDASSREKKIIAEIGPGYGRLCYVFAEKTDCKYVLFDIAPSLCIAESYFEEIYGDQVAPFQEYKSYDEVLAATHGKRFMFFTPDQIELFPEEHFDAVINIDSFGEMSKSSVSNYINIISKITKIGGITYFRNLSDVSLSHMEGVTFPTPSYNDYNIPGDWEVLFDRTFQLTPVYHEIARRRRS